MVMVIVHRPVVLAVLVPGVARVVVLGVEISGGGAVVAGSGGAAIVLAVPERGGEVPGRHRRTLWNKKGMSRNLQQITRYIKLITLLQKLRKIYKNIKQIKI